MIGFVNGEIEEMYDDRVLIDCGFMGYNIFVCGNVIESCSVGEEIKLYTYLNVREDAMHLFGFLTKDELKVFKLLITVNGIGPKGALAILTIMTPNDLRYAVMTEDSKLISKAPGVGAKTAQKVILELKDKLDIEQYMTSPDEKYEIKPTNSFDKAEIVEEATEALVALGYTQREIVKVIKTCNISECKTTEDIIKVVLKNI